MVKKRKKRSLPPELKKENITKKDLVIGLTKVAKKVEDDLYSAAMQDIYAKENLKINRKKAVEAARISRAIAEKARKEKAKQRKEAAEIQKAYLSFIGIDDDLEEAIKLDKSRPPKKEVEQEIKQLEKLTLREAQTLVEAMYNNEVKVHHKSLLSWASVIPKKAQSKKSGKDWWILREYVIEFVKNRCKLANVNGKNRVKCNTKKRFNMRRK